MSEIITKKFTGHDVAYLVGAIKNLEAQPEKMNTLPAKIGWLLSRNRDTLMPAYEKIISFRDEKIENLNKDFFYNEDKSYEDTQEMLDESGKPMVDAEGAPITEPCRRIKEEYVKEYEAAAEKVNQEIIEEANKAEEYFILTYNLDDYFDKLDDSNLTFGDIEFLKFMNQN